MNSREYSDFFKDILTMNGEEYIGKISFLNIFEKTILFVDNI